jgi:hypothetical protein
MYSQSPALNYLDPCSRQSSSERPDTTTETRKGSSLVLSLEMVDWGDEVSGGIYVVEFMVELLSLRLFVAVGEAGREEFMIGKGKGG